MFFHLHPKAALFIDCSCQPLGAKGERTNWALASHLYLQMLAMVFIAISTANLELCLISIQCGRMFFDCYFNCPKTNTSNKGNGWFFMCPFLPFFGSPLEEGTMDRSSWVSPMEPLCNIHMPIPQIHMSIMRKGHMTIIK